MRLLSGNPDVMIPPKQNKKINMILIFSTPPYQNKLDQILHGAVLRVFSINLPSRNIQIWIGNNSRN